MKKDECLVIPTNEIDWITKGERIPCIPEIMEYFQFRARKIRKDSFNPKEWKKISAFCFIEKGMNASKEFMIELRKKNNSHIVFYTIFEQNDFNNEIIEKISLTTNTSSLITDINMFGIYYNINFDDILFTFLVSSKKELIKEIKKINRRPKKKREVSPFILVKPNLFLSRTNFIT